MSFAPTSTLADRASVANALSAAASKSIAAAASARRQHLNWLFPMIFWWTMGAFIGVLAILRLAGLVSTWIALSSSRPPDAEKGSAAPQHLSSAARVWRSAKSLVNIALYRLPLPIRSLHNLVNVAEGVCVCAYLGATIAWSLMWTPNVGVAVNWAARSGYMGVVQIPFVIALTGKNNVISFLTGLSHEKLNGIHRAAGRSILIVSYVHTLGEIWKWHQSHKPKWHEPYVHWGFVALACLSITTAVSFRPIRKLSYELFLMSHIVLIFMFMVGMMVHRPDCQPYTWPGFIFWGFDRLLRLARLIYLNLFSSRSSPKSSTAGSTIIERISSDTVRLTVRRARNALTTWRPGQHFYVVAPAVSTLPWEAHPFTPSTIPHAANGSSEKDVELSFIVRGRDGFTGRLLQHAIAIEGASEKLVSTTVLVDGPYGEPPNLGVFDNVILIAGGSGVSYTLSMLLDRIHRAQRGKDRTSRVLFVWVIRDSAHIKWIEAALRTALSSNSGPRPLEIDIRIFVTRVSADSPEGINDSKPVEEKRSSVEELSADGLSVSPRVASAAASASTLVEVVEGRGGNMRIESGRPDLHKVIDEELAACDGLNVSVDVSGPAPLTAAVKNILSTSEFSTPAAALGGGPSVMMHTETFGW